MQELQLVDWTQQLAGLVVLASCAYMAAESPRPKVDALLSVKEPVSNPTGQKPRKKKDELSPEVQEFMHLPQNIQRQVLDYARNWISASFEKAD